MATTNDKSYWSRLLLLLLLLCPFLYRPSPSCSSRCIIYSRRITLHPPLRSTPLFLLLLFQGVASIFYSFLSSFSISCRPDTREKHEIECKSTLRAYIYTHTKSWIVIFRIDLRQKGRSTARTCYVTFPAALSKSPISRCVRRERCVVVEKRTCTTLFSLQLLRLCYSPALTNVFNRCYIPAQLQQRKEKKNNFLPQFPGHLDRDGRRSGGGEFFFFFSGSSGVRGKREKKERKKVSVEFGS